MMNSTPASQRTVIALAGNCNSGKSSLMNALCGQEAALVSAVAGTTTDCVSKAIEIKGIGPCVIVDTPGLDDNSELGRRRVRIAAKELERADMIVAVTDGTAPDGAGSLADRLKRYGVPVTAVMTKADVTADVATAAARIAAATGMDVTAVASPTRRGIESLFQRLAAVHTGEPESILGDLVEAGQTVVLVMPQDSQAPKGRLILPQSLTLRELLGRQCTAVCCEPSRLRATLDGLSRMPDLVITDSQVFGEVDRALPEGCRLTSFSVLMAGYKGDLREFVRGAAALDRLTEASRVLIAEACTHTPQNEDIGRVKLPRLLRKAVGAGLSIDVTGGKDFPDDLSRYDLVIHCGGCMITRRHVMSRVSRAVESGVPVTNYGIALAKLTGILDRIVMPHNL